MASARTSGASSRRWWLLAAVLVIACVAGATVLSSGRLSEVVAAKINQRFGLNATVESVRPRLGSTALHNLTAAAPDGNLRISADRVVVHTSPWMLALRGASSVRDVSVNGAVIADADGPLLLVDDGTARVVTNGFSFEANHVLAGDDTTDHVDLNQVAAELSTFEGFKIRSASIGSGNVRWVDSGSPLVARFSNALKTLRPKKKAAAPAATTAELPVFRRLTDDVDIAIKNLHVQSRTPGGQTETLDKLAVQVSGTDDGIRSMGEGRTSRDGHVRWNLTMWPNVFRAEGSLSFSGLPLSLVAPLLGEIPWHEPHAAMLAAKLDLSAQAKELIRVSGEFSLKDAALASEKIAPTPITDIDIDIRGEGAWNPEERVLDIIDASVSVDGVPAKISGQIQRTQELYRADLTSFVPAAQCDALIGAIPQDLLGELSAFQVEGLWRAEGVLKLDSRDLDATVFDLKVADGCNFGSAPVNLRRLRGKFWHRVVEPDETVFTMVTGPGSSNWTSLSDISPFVTAAIISHEDGGFYRHGGFAVWAIRDALVRNLKAGRFVLGASTISMQLVKNLFLSREKTLSRKAQEVILTWWLEKQMSKDELLELYLNVIEYGPGMYGIKHAARAYFGREPIDLSPAEAAFLACVLPSPKRFYANYEQGLLSPSMHNSVRRLLAQMTKKNRMGQGALDYGMAELQTFSFYTGEDTPEPRVLPPLFDEVLGLIDEAEFEQDELQSLD